jgi:hypothetical protein
LTRAKPSALTQASKVQFNDGHHNIVGIKLFLFTASAPALDMCRHQDVNCNGFAPTLQVAGSRRARSKKHG